MHNDTQNIFIDLPSDDSLSIDLTQILASGEQQHAQHHISPNIQDADILISSTSRITATLNSNKDLSKLKFVQLIDCGPAPDILSQTRVESGNNAVTIANTSPVLAPHVAEWCIEQYMRSDRIAKVVQNTATLNAGIIGFGMLGTYIAALADQKFRHIWISDIRTPRQLATLKLKVRRLSLDLLLSRSDVVFVAAHYGPTADPLLSRRELRLMGDVQLVINPSDHRVLERPTFDLPEVIEPDASNAQSIQPQQHAQKIVQFIQDNIYRIGQSQQPLGIVETIDYPPIGDPAFWSSKMHPNQTPL